MKKAILPIEFSRDVYYRQQKYIETIKHLGLREAIAINSIKAIQAYGTRSNLFNEILHTPFNQAFSRIPSKLLTNLENHLRECISELRISKFGYTLRLSAYGNFHEIDKTTNATLWNIIIWFIENTKHTVSDIDALNWLLTIIYVGYKINKPNSIYAPRIILNDKNKENPLHSVIPSSSYPLNARKIFINYYSEPENVNNITPDQIDELVAYCSDNFILNNIIGISNSILSGFTFIGRSQLGLLIAKRSDIDLDFVRFKGEQYLIVLDSTKLTPIMLTNDLSIPSNSIINIRTKEIIPQLSELHSGILAKVKLKRDILGNSDNIDRRRI